jgi:hypothetical protein
MRFIITSELQRVPMSLCWLGSLQGLRNLSLAWTLAERTMASALHNLLATLSLGNHLGN